MTLLSVIRRSLGFYWRTHLGVLLGAALGSTVLTGALLVGDSVQATLRQQALDRVGRAREAMLASDRFFQANPSESAGPSDDLAAATGSAPVLFLRGSVARPDGAARINQAQVVGTDARFWSLAPKHAASIPENQIALNARAASLLGAKTGDTLVVRVEKPSAFSRDAPLSGEDDEVVAIRATVGAILEDGRYGRFGLQASQVSPSTVFLPLETLQKRLDLPGKANLLLSGTLETGALRTAASMYWRLPDAGLELRPLKTGGVELRADRVFLDPAVVEAAFAVSESPHVSALTYFVNELRSGDHAAPYSMATAVDAAVAGFLPADLADSEIVINQWLADDLGIGPGAALTLKYFVMGDRRQLLEKSRDFKVRSVLPMSNPQVDSSWMPDFPGLADKNNCRDWKPGFAFDSTRIRDQDQEYWEKYRGTPKAFVNLRAGQDMWSNRWGNLTAMRWPAAADNGIEIGRQIRAKLTLEQLGFQFLPLRKQALAATNAPVDFGQLFVSFSFFLLAAAAVLTGLLFVFSLELRNREAGLLLAIGWRPRLVRRLFLAEGAMIAAGGGLLGLAGAVLYTRVVLWALGAVWSRAVGGAVFSFRAEPATLGTGLLSSVAVALLAMWLASRRQLRHSARELLASSAALELASGAKPKGLGWSLGIGSASILGAIGWLAFDRSGSPETFFCAGGLLLIGGLALGLSWLRRMAAKAAGLVSLPQLGRRNAARRRGRSLATAAVLSSGVFIVVAVDSFRQTPAEGAGDRLSGTGGFALLAESALPVYEDLGSASGREAFALDEEIFKGVSFVPMRVRDGDDASCLNLDRALQPRILGLRASELQARGAFRFSGAIRPDGDKGAPTPAEAWALLDGVPDDGAIPAIADDATLEWALQKKLGDTLEFRDERGQPFKVRLVAALGQSMLQGSILVSEAHFIEKYPNQGGYRFFLVDAPTGTAPAVARELSRGLTDRGLEVTPSARRLADFQAVENTYLSIFQALGGLGLLLGSVGLAIVVARNVLERRSEFGLLEALGFRRRDLRRLVFAEHRWLIVFGLAVGALSALVAVWPHLRQRTSGFPLREMILLLFALAAAALFWTWLATRLALRGGRIDALRNE